MPEAPMEQWRFLPTPEDEAWGLFVTAIGCGEQPGTPPPLGWRLHYLVRGAATLTGPGSRKQRVEAGEVVILRGGESGSLLPLPQQRCRCHHVDFAGASMERWVAAGLLGNGPQVIRAGFDENLLGLMVKLVEAARSQAPHPGRLLAGLLGNLLAQLERVATMTTQSPQHHLVQEARRLLSDPGHDQLKLETAAVELGVSYSWFRRAFRTQTGLSPQRFRLSQRLDRACQLLADSSLSVGKVSALLGFSSQAYFARMFRKETGFSPSVWRTKHMG